MRPRELLEKGRAFGIRRGDIVIIALLLLLSAALAILPLACAGTPDCARVCVDGRQVALLPLDKNADLALPDGGMGNVVRVEDGRVCMLRADCPDGSCVAQGWIERPGECICCLPGRVTVTICSDSGEGGLDAVAY